MTWAKMLIAAAVLYLLFRPGKAQAADGAGAGGAGGTPDARGEGIVSEGEGLSIEGTFIP